MIEAAQRGDGWAESELLRRFEPLVQCVVRRLRSPDHCESDDLAQEARIGLLGAIRAWRPERGTLVAFAQVCASYQAVRLVDAQGARKHQLLSRAVSLDAPPRPRLDNGPAPALLDVLVAGPDARVDPECRVLVREEMCCVLRALPRLSARERTALGGTLAGQSQKRLASALGVSVKAASHAVLRARRKLAAALPHAA